MSLNIAENFSESMLWWFIYTVTIHHLIYLYNTIDLYWTYAIFKKYGVVPFPFPLKSFANNNTMYKTMR